MTYVAAVVHVADVDAGRAWSRGLDRLESLGAELYRGPMNIDDEPWMCQVRYPWGNCIGLRCANVAVDVAVTS